MQGWTDGYVTEIAYTHGFHDELLPWPMMAALADAGRPVPVAPGGTFDYCELGFGQGFSLALMAAANPQARFWGNDFNPDHVAHVAGLAARAGLANLQVSSRGFADYDDGSLPDFDIIALHGVWSWVGPGARADIVRFIDRRLKPGGVVYLGYNALPGWAQYLPLRRVMLDHARRGQGDLAGRIGAALDMAGRLEGEGAGYFRINPTVGPRRDMLAGKDAAYLAHEYFNESWEPVYFTDLAAALAPAGLRLAAQARAADRWEEAGQVPAIQAVGGEAATDPDFAEMLRDFLTNRPFRRDLFQREGGDPYLLGAKEAGGWVVALAHPRDLPRRATLPTAGTIDPPWDLSSAVLTALQAGPAQVVALAVAVGKSPDEMAPVLRLLTALGLIGPALPPSGLADRQITCDRLNRAIMAEAHRADRLTALASPVTGGAVAVDRISQLFLDGLAKGAAPVSFTWKVLQAAGQRVTRDGKPLLTEKQNLAELEERWLRFQQRRLPVLNLLGATQQNRRG